MKKKVILTLVILLMILGGVVALAVGGSLKDPLISLEYLNNNYHPTVKTQVEQKIDDAYSQSYEEAQKKLDAETEQYRSQLGDSSDAWSYHPSFSVQKCSMGDTISLKSGSGLLFIEGNAVVSVRNGELIDVTNGISASNLKLAAGNRYLLGEGATAIVTVQSDAALLAIEGYSQNTVSGQDAMPFTDLTNSAWYYKAVKYVYDNELFHGVSADHFSPEGSVTRAMLATILYRLAGEPNLKGLGDKFTDVIPGMWYEVGIQWSADAGIVNGMGFGKFEPNINVTREQMAVMLYRYAADYLMLNMDVSGDVENFTDHSTISVWAKQGMSWAVGAGILNGDTEGALNPYGSASRAEAAAMIQRFSKWIS